MSSFVAQIIFSLLQYRRAPITQTEIFSNLKHNRDLCPKFQRKIELILESYQNYQQITYDIQGFQDKGSDVIIKQQTNEENEYICLQIKSEWDFDQGDYMKTLKAQAFESQRRYEKLIDYYIIGCCDLAQGKERSTKRYNQIRAVSSEFATDKDIHVIEPQYALGFLQLNSIQIDAAIKAKLGVDDVVFRMASDTVVDMSATERAVLFRMIWISMFAQQSSIGEREMKWSNFSGHDPHARIGKN